MGNNGSKNTDGGGLVIFEDVSQAIRGEKVLRSGGYEVKLIAPPPKYRMGCDLGIAVNLVEKAGIERLLREKEVDFINILPNLEGTAELLSVVKTTDYGKWTMIKAGNMKLAFEKGTGLMVNTSGGGCPDIPYLHAEMVGKKLAHAPKPSELGYTLCALMLDRAYEEALTIWNGGN
ncbi:MAG: DUF3343 domain-containing protein [Dehalococcoidales bacterium]|nr:DUF3343 domain-containing protein [Dehalococcoidales bacterium]